MIVKKIVTEGLTSIFRAYVRYAPTQIGKRLMFNKVINPYLSWRSFSTVATTIFGAKLAVSLPDLIQSRIYFFGFWEPQLTYFIKSGLKDGDYFVDVGANIGYFSLLASRIVGPKGRVFAVEASPCIFRKLEHNGGLNNCENISFFNIAASDAHGTLEIYLGNSENLGATTTVASVALLSAQKLEAKIPAAPLSAIIGEENLLNARIIKIDVEGAEPSVIRGIAALLHKFGDKTEWIIEISPQWSNEEGDETGKLIATFREAGYKLYKITNDYRIGAYLYPDSNDTLVELDEVIEQADVVASKRR
jgi:FkbM family methyltransferase